MKNLNASLKSFVIFRSILQDTVIQKFITLMEDCHKSEVKAVNAYSDFVAALYETTDNFSDYLLNFMVRDENLYMLQKAQNKTVSPFIETALKNELKILETLSAMKSETVRATIGYNGFLPDWNNTEYHFDAIYQERIENISVHGYGIFAQFHTFVVSDGALQPVESPDPITLQQLSGYERERSKIIANTEALLSNKPATNVLLYGDAGTGKSSSVKAIANEYKNKGLRLIELKKNQLYQIPAIMDSLSKNPLKFILFIDDLSFTKDDDDFSALKAILEGSVSVKNQNIAVYATSNRRHLVKETFSSRDGDDVHISDTLEELSSLSDRFGLTVTFIKPDKELYLDIVADLADQYDIQMNREELIRKAESHALRHGGRSPRVAKQFIEFIKTLE